MTDACSPTEESVRDQRAFEHQPLPAMACDSHVHVFDPNVAGLKPLHGSARLATANACLERCDALGLDRVVVVQPTNYGTDNNVTIAALDFIGRQRSRGIAVLHPSVTDAELSRLHAGGIRGLRFTLANPASAVTHPDMIEPLAGRVACFGWHIQLNLSPSQIVEQFAMLANLPCPVVFDHFAHLPSEHDEGRPAMALVLRLMASKRAWMKLSAPYLYSAPDDRRWGHVQPLMDMLLCSAPDRLIWGTDWPHVTQGSKAPTAGELYAAFCRWVPDATLRHRILVDNPGLLYQF